jgi:hypothetical protein
VRYFEVAGEVLEYRRFPRIDAVAPKEAIVDLRPRFGLEVGRGNVEHVVEVLLDLEPAHHRLGVPARAVGEDELAAGQACDRRAEHRIGGERRMIDLMHDGEELVGVEAVLLHQPAHGRAVAPVVVLLHPERLVVGDVQETDDAVADAGVDLLPEIEVMRIERVVEIKHPGLDRVETAHGATLIHFQTTRCCHSSRQGGLRLSPNQF